LSGQAIRVPPRGVIILAVAELAGDDTTKTVENPESIDRHGFHSKDLPSRLDSQSMPQDRADVVSVTWKQKLRGRYLDQA
jgi:hypothetical protein